MTRLVNNNSTKYCRHWLLLFIVGILSSARKAFTMKTIFIIIITAQSISSR